MLSGSLARGPCPCLFVLLSSLHYVITGGGQGSRQSQSNITNVITSAHQSWVIILVQSGQCPFVHWTQEKQLCYCKNVMKLRCSTFWQRGTWSAFLIRLVTRQRIVIRPGDSRRALPDTTQVFIKYTYKLQRTVLFICASRIPDVISHN